MLPKLREIVDRPGQALFWAFALGLVPFFHWLALVLMVLVTLRKGLREGAVVGLMLAVLGVVMLFILFKHAPVGDVIMQGLSPFALVLLAYLLRRSGSWQTVLLALTLAGLLFLIGAYVFFGAEVQVWTAALMSNIQQVSKDNPAFMGGVDLQTWQAMLQYLGRFALGLRVMVILISAILTLIAGRYFQAFLYNPGGLKLELYGLHLDLLPGVLFLLLVVLGFVIKKPLFSSMLPVLAVPFTCVGLSVFHSLTAISKFQWLILLVFYVLMFSVAPYLLIGATFLGMLDPLVNFRERFKR